jgi:hypothetical protein
LGEPVVPDVNWMLMASKGLWDAITAASGPLGADRPDASTSSKSNMPGVASPPSRMTVRRLGTRAASSSPGLQSASSGARSWSMAM